MDTTASCNIKSFKKGQSYGKLKTHHFDIYDRYEKGIARSKELECLNGHYIMSENHDEVMEYLEDKITAYNNKPSQKKNKKRQYKDLESYVHEKKQAKNINPDFHGVNFMMVNKLGDMETREKLTDIFTSHGVTEKEMLDCFTFAFIDHAKWFNDEFSDCNLYLSQIDINLDEIGGVHYHGDVVNYNVNKNDMPDLNLSNALKTKYGKGNNKHLMSLFRHDVDSKLVEYSNVYLKDLAYFNDFEFEGLDLIRTNSKDVGKDHERYKQDKENERLKKENINLQEQNQRISKDIEQRLSYVERREWSIKDKDHELQEREVEVSQREQNVLKGKIRLQKDLEELREAKAIEDNRVSENIEYINLGKQYKQKLVEQHKQQRRQQRIAKAENLENKTVSPRKSRGQQAEDYFGF